MGVLDDADDRGLCVATRNNSGGAGRRKRVVQHVRVELAKNLAARGVSVVADGASEGQGVIP